MNNIEPGELYEIFSKRRFGVLKDKLMVIRIEQDKPSIIGFIYCYSFKYKKLLHYSRDLWNWNKL